MTNQVTHPCILLIAVYLLNVVRFDTTMLFKPAVAIRARPSSFTGTPLPKDEPSAANPPDGAIIDYALPPSVKAQVTLTVHDGFETPGD